MKNRYISTEIMFSIDTHLFIMWVFIQFHSEPIDTGQVWRRKGFYFIRSCQFGELGGGESSLSFYFNNLYQKINKSTGRRMFK